MSITSIDNTVNDSIGANGQSVVLDVRRHAAATVTLTGTWSGTIAFEASPDGATWVAVNAAPVPSGSSATSATANGTWLLNVAAMASLRLRSSAWASGAATVSVRASLATVPVLAPGSIPFANASGALAQATGFAWDSTNLTLKNDQGQNVTAYTGPWTGRRIHVTDGTVASPVVTPNPTMKISRVDGLTSAITGNGVDGSQSANLGLTITDGGNTTTQQLSTLWAEAWSYGAGAKDVIPGMFLGRGSGAGTGNVGATYHEGSSEVSNRGVIVSEFRVKNLTGVDGAFNNSVSASTMSALWLTVSSTNTANAGNGASAMELGGLTIGLPTQAQWHNGFVAKLGSVIDNAFRDESHAAVSLLIHGGHQYGIDMNHAGFGNQVTVYTVTGGGTGYDPANPPTVTLSGGSPIVAAQAHAIVSVGGVVTAVRATYPGGGYGTTPTVTIAAPASGTTATATATLSGAGSPLRLPNNTNIVARNSGDGSDQAIIGLGSDNKLYLLNGAIITTTTGDSTIFRDLYAASIKATTGTTTGIAIAPTLTPGASAADGTAIGGGVLATGTTTPGTYTNVHVIAATKTGTGVPPVAVGFAVDAPTIGTTNIAAKFGGDVQINSLTLNFYDFGGGFVGKPATAATDMPIPIPRALTIPANMTGAQAIAKTGATASAAFTIAKVSGGVTTTIGTLTFAAGGQGAAQTGTFTTPSGAAQSLAAGDYVIVTAPTQDATLADIAYVVTGTWY